MQSVPLEVFRLIFFLELRLHLSSPEESFLITFFLDPHSDFHTSCQENAVLNLFISKGIY